MTNNVPLRAVPTALGYILEDFKLKYLPLVIDQSLFDDIALYAIFCWRYGLIMGWASLLFMGHDAIELWRRRGGSRERWSAFERAAQAYNDAVKETAMITRQLTREVANLATGNPRGAARPWKPTSPEVSFGAAMMRKLSKCHPELLLTADQSLSSGSPRRTDFVLTRRDGLGGTIRIELNGFQDRYGRPRTNYGVDYAARQPARLRAYADAGLEPPITVYADEVSEACLLSAAVRRVLAELTDIQQPHFAPDADDNWYEIRPNV